MVGNGDLHAHDLIDERHVAHHVARKGGRGIAVIARKHQRRDARCFERTRFEQQVLEAAGNAIRPQKAEHGGDAVLGKIRKLKFRYAGAGPILPASARHMHMQIHKARAYGHALKIERFNAGHRFPIGKILLYEADLRADDKNVPPAKVRRRIHIAIFPELDHIVPPYRAAAKGFAPRRSFH